MTTAQKLPRMACEPDSRAACPLEAPDPPGITAIANGDRVCTIFGGLGQVAADLNRVLIYRVGPL